MIIRSKTFKTWLKARFGRGELRDIAQYGASAGWPGLTYYADTCKLYSVYREEMWEVISDMADSLGVNTFAVLADGNKDYTNVANASQAENYIVWVVAEEYARQLTEEA